jgi:hypothetical protein
MMLQHTWDKFWFTPSQPKTIGFFRIGWSLLTIAYLCSWFSDIGYWLSSQGILAPDRLAELLQSAADEQPIYLRISPLFWIQSEAALLAYLWLGILFCLVASLGLGGRYSSLVVWLFLLSIIHRAPMLTGLCEPLLTMGWGYMVIHPGKTKSIGRIGLGDCDDSVAANIAMRLLQLHLFAWVVLSLASRCGGLVWWQGEAVWWLASEARSPALSLDWLGRNPFALNALTHGLVTAELLALFMLWPAAFRKWGVIALWSAAALLVLISDQLLYPIAVATLAITFWPMAQEQK